MRKPRAVGVSPTTDGRRGSGCRFPRKRRSCGRAETASRAALPRCARGRSHPARSPRGPGAPRPRSHRTDPRETTRSEEHTSDLQLQSHISYAVFCLKKKKKKKQKKKTYITTKTYKKLQ